MSRSSLRLGLAAAVLVLASLPVGAGAQVAPWRSFRKLTTGNGFAASVIDLDTRRLVSFRENLYRYPAPGRETKELAYDLYLGLRAAGQSAWLTDVAFDEAGYEPGTGLIRTVQRRQGLRVTTTYVAPFGLDARAVLVVAEIVNEGPADISDVALFSLHNFHTGAGANQTRGERITWDAALGAYVEKSAEVGAPSGALVVKPLTPAARHTASPMNPFPLVRSAQLFGDVADSGVFDDAVSGFQLDVAGRQTFARGARASFAILVGWAPDSDAGALVSRFDAFHASRTPEELLEAERAGWRAWHRAGRWPLTGSAIEGDVAQQALAVLRMAQVREPGSPRGQLLASLPPGKWDITWLRDGVYATLALIETGHYDEAEASLEFFLRGPHGAYQSYVGRPYGLTVCRHYGNGAEESDSNLNGPNIELDGFGLFLEAAARFVEASGRTAWFDTHAPVIDPGIASVLMEARDAETGLIMADSSIWESHWTNGGRQRWAFTSGSAIRGLSAWARLVEARAGAADPRVARYRAGADSLRRAISAHLVDASGAIASSVEQLRAGTGRHADAQAVLFLGADTFTPASPTGIATLDLLRNRLFLGQTTRRGYKRNDDGDLYDEREWVVIDLATSRALRAASRGSEADALVGWITGQAEQNYLLVPELYDQTDARYEGETPMIGFGAGAYVLALVDRSGTTAPVFPGDGDAGTTTSDGGSPVADAGAPDTGAPAADASAADAASAVPDAIVDPTDGGTPTHADAEGARVDASPVAPDAGPATTPDARPSGAADARSTKDDGGTTVEQSECSCRTANVSNSGRPSDSALLLALLSATLATRGRRARRRR